MTRPVLSVVIPTFNRGDSLRATLDSVENQHADVPYEIIVVDNNSTDATPDIVRSYGRARYIFEGRQGVSHARNSGVEHANGSLIVFIDDDAIAAPDWLQQIQQVYVQKPDAWCVGGKVVLRFSGVAPGWFEAPTLARYLSGQDRGDETFQVCYPDELWEMNFSISRLAWAKVGGFRTDLGPTGTALICGEGTDLNWRVHRAGGRVYYCGRAMVEHVVPSSRMTRAYFRRRACWNGRTGRLLGMKRSSLRQLLLFVAWLQARRVLGRAVSPVRSFEASLDTWWYLGHLYQSFLCTFPKLRDRSGRGKMQNRRTILPL